MPSDTEVVECGCTSASVNVIETIEDELFMNEPLPYLVFVAGVCAAVTCLVVLLCAAYRLSAKLRDMAGFVVLPAEYSTPDLRLGSVFMSLFWLLVINFAVTTIYHFVDIGVFNSVSPDSSTGSARDVLPLWVIILLPPVLEETAFRLPLRRKRMYVTLGAAAITFIVSALVSSTAVYSLSWPRLAACAVVAVIFWWRGCKWVRKINFRAWFWFMALFFSLLHVMNYGADAAGAGEWVRVAAKELVKLPSALMFGYIRLRHGFFVSVALHLVNNLFPIMLMDIV